MYACTCIFSDEELREAVANADSGNGNTAAVPVAGEAVAGGKAGAAGEEWDCIFTDLAVLTFPEGQPEGDPVKVNEYELDEHLGAGEYVVCWVRDGERSELGSRDGLGGCSADRPMSTDARTHKG